MEIRKPTIHDSEAYVEFRKQAHTESDYVNTVSLEDAEERIKEYLDDPLKDIWFLFNGKENIGQLFLETNKDSRILHVRFIAVLASTYGTGSARKLMDKATSIAKSHQVEQIHLVVRDDNVRAITFYKKCGFQYLSGYKKNTQLMTKVISHPKKKSIIHNWK